MDDLARATASGGRAQAVAWPRDRGTTGPGSLPEPRCTPPLPPPPTPEGSASPARPGAGGAAVERLTCWPDGSGPGCWPPGSPERFPPCAVADVGGGKELLTWLLLQDGFRAEGGIGQSDQPLPTTYRDHPQRPPGPARPAATVPPAGRLRGRARPPLRPAGRPARPRQQPGRARHRRHRRRQLRGPTLLRGRQAGRPRAGQNWFLWLVERARSFDWSRSASPSTSPARASASSSAARGPSQACARPARPPAGPCGPRGRPARPAARARPRSRSPGACQAAHSQAVAPPGRSSRPASAGAAGDQRPHLAVIRGLGGHRVQRPGPQRQPAGVGHQGGRRGGP